MTSAITAPASKTAEPENRSSLTLADSAYEQLRVDILAGRYPAGSKLAIHSLREHYQIGASPLREALNRLTADGFVSLIGQRGFRVTPVSLADLRDVTRLRIFFETEALRDSIACGNDEWEAGIVSAYHRLSKIDATRYNDLAGWETRNAAFHDALVAACPSPRLLQFRQNLYDQHKRYRSLSTTSMVGSRDIPGEHREMMALTLARDAGRACALVATHIRATAELLEAVLAEKGEA